MSFKYSTKTDQLLHSLITKLIRFFNYEWSGALIAIIVLSFAIELSTDGRPFLHISNIMTIFNNLNYLIVYFILLYFIVFKFFVFFSGPFFGIIIL